MTYINQTFNSGAALTSQQLNQFEENIKLARTQHIGSEQPTELTQGILWIDDSVTPYEWKIYTGTEWLVFAKIDPDNAVAWGLTGDSVTDTNTPTISTTSIDVNIDIAASTWESVGPTGSGADNIWTALDSLPLEADWVELRIRADTINTGDFVNYKMWARKTGSSLGATDSTLVAHHALALPGRTAVQVRLTTQAMVPVDGSNRFDLQWQRIAGTSGANSVLLVGYGFNR